MTRREQVIGEIRKRLDAGCGTLDAFEVAVSQLIAAGDPKILALYLWLAHEFKELVITILEQYR